VFAAAVVGMHDLLQCPGDVLNSSNVGKGSVTDAQLSTFSLPSEKSPITSSANLH